MTPMQTPSKAGDLDRQGRSRDAEAVWVMPLQAKGPQTATPSAQRVRGQAPPRGLKRPQPCRQTAWS